MIKENAFLESLGLLDAPRSALVRQLDYMRKRNALDCEVGDRPTWSDEEVLAVRRAANRTRTPSRRST